MARKIDITLPCDLQEGMVKDKLQEGIDTNIHKLYRPAYAGTMAEVHDPQLDERRNKDIKW